ncbi:hypothetical protein CLOM_g8268, partial [Closterium sp. NIES-68]
LLRQGGSGELAFYHSFVEDRSATGMGYGEFCGAPGEAGAGEVRLGEGRG